ncbi:MAG: type II secretion system protein [Bacilli bacterium]|nr:type II secretion system protein [Bacilli bacterium]
MTQNRGFTLVELLAVIVVLGIILLIAVPNVLNIITKAKEDANKRQISLIISAMRNYAAEYPPILPPENDYEAIRISELIEKGFLKTDISDLVTGESIANDCVVITNLSSGKYSYEYAKGNELSCPLE